MNQTTFQNLLTHIHTWLNAQDKEFLIEFKKGNISYRDYHWLSFPSIQRKLDHLMILKSKKPEIHRQYVQALEAIFKDTPMKKKSIIPAIQR